MNFKSIKFSSWLGIVSIIGFLVIFVNSVFTIDLSAWADSLLFLIIGFALFLAGGARFFIYFKDGKLSPSEINRMVTVLVGIASMITGVLIAPYLDYQLAVLNGVKAIISSIAVLVIVIEIFNSQRGE